MNVAFQEEVTVTQLAEILGFELFHAPDQKEVVLIVLLRLLLLCLHRFSPVFYSHAIFSG